MYPYPLPDIKAGYKYVIYGTGEIAEQYYRQLIEEYGQESVVFFLDSFPVRTVYKDKPVLGLNDLAMRIDKNDYCYLICSIASKHVMTSALLNIGINENEIVQPCEPLCNLVINHSNLSSIKRILFFPSIDSEVEMDNILVRCSWYMPNTSNISINVEMSSPIELSKSIPQNIKIISKIDEFALDYADIILVWKKSELLHPQIVKRRDKVYCVDPTFFSIIEADVYRNIYFASLDKMQKEEFVEQSKKNYSQMIIRNKEKRHANVFGTGPSVEEAYQYDYTNQFNVICNSIVKNEDMVKHINPDLLVFADPVFHFSPCEYAISFRENAFNVALQYDCYVIVPDVTVPLLLAHYPQIKERLIGIPIDYGLSLFHFPTVDQFFVAGSSNILTLYMIPITSSISESISIIGCDGRRPSETYFWEHNSSTQYNDLMNTVFKMHPSFFNDRSYVDYYDKHCDLLRRMILYGEEKGKKYTSLTKSYIPVLAERTSFI